VLSYGSHAAVKIPPFTESGPCRTAVKVAMRVLRYEMGATEKMENPEFRLAHLLAVTRSDIMRELADLWRKYWDEPSRKDFAAKVKFHPVAVLLFNMHSKGLGEKEYCIEASDISPRLLIREMLRRKGIKGHDALKAFRTHITMEANKNGNKESQSSGS
jgi:hypothetical protein